MFNPKPAASLSSGLLARKGQARPAMRPQGFVGMTHEALEDLGWNDMGDSAPIDHVGNASAGYPEPEVERPEVLRQRDQLGHILSPAEPGEDLEAENEIEEVAGPASVQQAPTPQQPEQHQAVEPQQVPAAPKPQPVAAPPAPKPVAAEPERRSVSVNTATRLRKETRAKKGKAAFTLRLDAERHLRLRLASAIRNESAQHLVTEALDTFLNSLPEIDDLVSQVGAGRGR